MSTEDRYLRQKLIVPDKIQSQTGTVIGVGATGRPLALCLAHMGIGRLRIIDPDTVELHNCANQGYAESDVGKDKVSALAFELRKSNPGLLLEAAKRRWKKEDAQCDSAVVFCCVDSIETRGRIFRAYEGLDVVWVDPRVASEVCRIVAGRASDLEFCEYYRSTLFRESEGWQGTCTAQLTMYIAYVAAGLCVHQYTRALRGMPFDRDMTFSLLDGSLLPT